MTVTNENISLYYRKMHGRFEHHRKTPGYLPTRLYPYQKSALLVKIQ